MYSIKISAKAHVEIYKHASNYSLYHVIVMMISCACILDSTCIAQDMIYPFICNQHHFTLKSLEIYNTTNPGFCAYYQKYIHVANVTTQGDAIMNSLNV